MENNKHVFVFNVTRSNNDDDNLSLLECFSVPEGGEYSVSVHEIHYGVVQEHVYTQGNITVWITESMPSVQWVPLNIIPFNSYYHTNLKSETISHTFYSV